MIDMINLGCCELFECQSLLSDDCASNEYCLESGCLAGNVYKSEPGNLKVTAI